MTRHVDLAIAERMARVAAEKERKRLEREELAAARAAGLRRRHASKLQRQAERQADEQTVMTCPEETPPS
ncbi:hypothetical protein ACWDBD_03765 [Streptomyces sp. NPDC001118]